VSISSDGITRKKIVPGNATLGVGLDRLAGVDRKKLASQVAVIPVGRSSEELCQVELRAKKPVSSLEEAAVGAEDLGDGFLGKDFAAVPCNRGPQCL
jgi:hypothetical protein